MKVQEKVETTTTTTCSVGLSEYEVNLIVKTWIVENVPEFHDILKITGELDITDQGLLRGAFYSMTETRRVE